MQSTAAWAVNQALLDPDIQAFYTSTGFQKARAEAEQRKDEQRKILEEIRTLPQERRTYRKEFLKAFLPRCGKILPCGLPRILNTLIRYMHLNLHVPSLPSLGELTREHPFVLAMVVLEGLPLTALPDMIRQYIAAKIPGKPAFNEIDVFHARAIREIEDFSLAKDKDWLSFVVRKDREQQEEWDANNPFMPKLLGKTDDGTLFTSDMAGFSTTTQENVANLCREQSPSRMDSVMQILEKRPVAPSDVRRAVLEAAMGLSDAFNLDMGVAYDKNQEFCASKSLCMMAAWGWDGLRVFADRFAAIYEDEYWTFIANCTDKELLDELLNAHKVSGYPLGSLLWIDFHDLYDLLEPEASAANSPVQFPPRFLKACFVTFLIRYVWIATINGRPFIIAMYCGRCAQIPLKSSAAGQPLSAMVSQSDLVTLCNVLRIQRKKADKRNVLDRVVCDVLNTISPSQFPRQLDCALRPEIVPPPRARVIQAGRPPEGWIDPGVAIRDVSRISFNTGEVDRNAMVMGADAVAVSWPLERDDLADPEENAAFNILIPDRVVPALPAEMLLDLVGNLNTCGQEKGLMDLYNGIVIGNLVRRLIAGSKLGSKLQYEYPIMPILPTGSSTLETTNQGKNTTALYIVRIWVPGLNSAVRLSLDTGAPAARQMMFQIEEFGTIVCEEYVLIQDPQHILSAAALMSMATGGTQTPGKARENGRGVRLRLPPLLIMKFCDYFEDVYNRTFPTMLDVLTPSNSATPKELARLTSGEASMETRLSTLLYVHKHGIVDKIMKCDELVTNVWRFDAHATIARLLGGDPDAMKAYLTAAREKMTLQSAAAGKSGLKALVGGKQDVDFEALFEDLHENALHELTGLKQDVFVKRTDAARILIEDRGLGGKHLFLGRELERFKLGDISRASTVLGEQLGKGSFIRTDGLVMESLPEKLSDGKNKVHHVRVYRPAVSK